MGCYGGDVLRLSAVRCSLLQCIRRSMGHAAIHLPLAAAHHLCCSQLAALATCCLWQPMSARSPDFSVHRQPVIACPSWTSPPVQAHELQQLPVVLQHAVPGHL